MKYFITVLSFYTIVTFSNAQVACNINALSDSCKHYLKPYHYDAVNAMHVTLKSQPQEKEIDFPTFSGQHYRILLNINAMPKGTEVNVYEQDISHKKRKSLYSLSDPNGEVGVCDMDCKSGKFFIDYTIPAAEPTLPPTGCAVVIFGYQGNTK